MAFIKNKKGEWEYYGVGYSSQEKPKCAVCGKEMENAIDSITKELSEYLWKTTCGHSKNMILSRG